MQQEKFSNPQDYTDLMEIMDGWTVDEEGMKGVFIRLAEQFSKKEEAVLSFIKRPGISYSFRARTRADSGEGTLITMVDIVDDDPENRWLSVCFYGDYVTDPDEEGDLVPGGLLGEDGYCFDLYDSGEEAVSYVADRINEAYENTVKN